MDWRTVLVLSVTEIDQKSFVKIFTLLGHEAPVIGTHLKQAVGEKAVSIECIKRWQTRFRNGDPNAREDDDEPIIDDALEINFSPENYHHDDPVSGLKDRYIDNQRYDVEKRNTFTKDYIRKNCLTILNKSLNAHKWLIQEESFELILVHTYQTESCEPFWKFAQREIYRKIDSLTVDIHTVCWKFLFLLHWMLRNGHRNVIQDSYRQRPLLIELGKIKKCVESSNCLFAQLNPLYLSLLFHKIEFHIEHTAVPGNLVVNQTQLERTADPSDFCSDCFEYMEKILNLQTEVLNVRGLTGSSEPQHQCLLNPLKLCIIESVQLYEIIFHLMTRLHATTGGQPDLDRHRERFATQFQQLKQFYRKCQQFPFLINSIQVPDLVDQVPDFTKL